MSEKEIRLPVSSTFDRRLAELVWENCSELAKQTAAGKIALSLDIPPSEINKLLNKEIQSAVAEWVKESLPNIKANVIKRLEQGDLAIDIAKQVKDQAYRSIAVSDLTETVNKVVMQFMEDMMSTMFGSDNANTRTFILSRVDAYIERRMSTRQASDAIQDGQNRLNAANLSPK